MNNKRSPSICIVTPDYLSATPRVVKEADALFAAGFAVRVVCGQGSFEHLREYDAQLMRGRGWKISTVGWSQLRRAERFLYHWSRLRYHAAQWIPERFSAISQLRGQAEHRIYPELAALAASEAADLYIGHYPAGLAAAAYAADRTSSRIGYDMEDCYRGVESDNAGPSTAARRIAELERHFMPRCAYISAASEGIAQEAEQRWGRRPLVLHNVFPWADRARLDGQVKDRRGPALSLYWYSQAIGAGRGIEDAVRAAGLLPGPVQIHLRGACAASMKQTLLALTKDYRTDFHLYFHPPVHPDELLSRAAEHDIGLALETKETPNHRLTVSNKLFLYLLAGVAIAASDTPGQINIMRTCPDAGFVYESGNVQGLADRLSACMESKEHLEQTKAAALRAARDGWNWERESRCWVQAIQKIVRPSHDLSDGEQHVRASGER